MLALVGETGGRLAEAASDEEAIDITHGVPTAGPGRVVWRAAHPERAVLAAIAALPTTRCRRAGRGPSSPPPRKWQG